MDLTMKKLIATALLLGTFSCINASIAATPSKPAAPAASPQQFVQAFYDWYAFKGKDGPDNKGEEAVLKQKKQLLDPTLYKLLVGDVAASAKSPGEIVGLDFDPFVAANGLFYSKYQTAAATKSGTSYRIPVYGVENGKRVPKVVVDAEVASQNGHFVFTNFHYGKSEFPENENLISVLNVLRKQRNEK